MRIAFLTGKFHKDMKEASLLTMLGLAKYFQKKRHKVVIFGTGGVELEKHEIIEGIEVYRGPFIKSKYVVPAYHPAFIFNNLFSPIVAYFWCKEKFDIIHGFSSSPLLSYRTILPKLFNGKILGIHSIKSFSKYSGKKPQNFKYMNKLNSVITNLNLIKAHLESGGVLSQKINVVRSNIDEQKFFKMSKCEKQSLRNKHGFSDSKAVLYYGPIVERKGINYLLTAFSQIEKEVRNCKLILAYKDAVIIDTHLHNVKKYASSLGINPSNLFFVAPGVKIEDYVNFADVVVLSYPELIGTEGNPSCVLESMACGTPVVTSDLPELREFLTDDEVYFAEPKNPESIAEKIIEVFENRGLREKKIKNSLEKVKDFYTEKIADEHLKLYEDLLKKKKRNL